MTVIDRSGCTARRHGDESAYSWWNCRCPDAREAWRIYKKRLREGRHTPRHTDATGTANRLRALHAIGYTWADLGRHLERHRRWVGGLAAKEHPTVALATDRVIRALYDRLKNAPAPPSQGAGRARRYAERHGWWTPAQWEPWGDLIDYPEPPGEVDEFDVKIALARATQDEYGTVAALPEPEREFAARRLLAQGAGVKRVCAITGVGERALRKLRDTLHHEQVVAA